MTIATATLLRDGKQHNVTSLAAATPTGTISVSVEGNVIVFQGLKAALIGDPARYDNSEVYTVVKDASAYVAGQTVYWDPVNTVPATTGFIRMGRATKVAASGDATVEVRLFRDAAIQRSAQVAASTAVTATTVATVFDKTAVLPASYLQAGDVIKVRAQVVATATNSTDTLTLALLIGATAIITTAAVDVANGDVGYFDFDITVRTIGASGTLVATGSSALGTPGTVTAKPAFLASTAVDTTAAQTIGVQATWSTNNAGNSCRLDVLNVQLFRA
jgi:hypothetical protein